MNKFIAAVVVAVVAAGGAYLIASGGSDSVPESESEKVQFDSYEKSEAQNPSPTARDDSPSKDEESTEAKEPNETPTEVEVVRMGRDKKTASADGGTNTAKPGDGSPENSRPTVNPEDLKAIQSHDNLEIKKIEIPEGQVDKLDFRSIQRNQNNQPQDQPQQE